MAANDVPCCETMFWVYLFTCVTLVCFAGLMSGLTLGLMSLSLVDLEVLSKAGKPQDRKNAEKILPLVKNQHLLLCTLLIYNAMAMEVSLVCAKNSCQKIIFVCFLDYKALPIFLDSILPAWCSILISVTLILAFGEIIPQAICSRYGLSVGAKLAVLVRLLVIILLPLSYPISKILDWVLGKDHSTLLRRSELKTFVDLHGNEAGKGGELTHDETAIIGGALELAQKTAKDVMTPMSRVFSLDCNDTLNKDTLELIMRKGHSRIPIYSGTPTNIIGILLVKNLIVCQFEDEMPIRDLTIRIIPRFHENQPLYDILNQFQKGNSHMGIVVKCKQSLKSTTEITSDLTRFEVKVHINGSQDQPQRKGQNGRLGKDVQKGTSRKACVMCCTGTRTHKDKPQYTVDATLMDDLDSYDVTDEEVIGIITMEDVMEELIQEEILDETDEYVDVHNRIAINMQPIRILSPRTSGLGRRTPAVASPVSPYYNNSPCSCHQVTCSPLPTYIASPLARPSLLNSTATASPTTNLRPSLSPQWVCQDT
ncbi:hypothetical protein V2J09_011219 [Rumex salicifolius]